MFEWHEVKRRSNLIKHHLDFRDAASLFDGRARLDGAASFHDEVRYATVAELRDMHVTLIWTGRDERRRLISFRRARREERQAYRQAFGGGADSDG